MQSVAERIAEIRRTRKRPNQVIANWAGRERRAGNGWLADSIIQQAEMAAPSIVPTKPKPVMKPLTVPAQIAGPVDVVPRKPWWIDD